MARRRYRSSPEGGVLEVDAASASPGHRRAAYRPESVVADRTTEREGARDLDKRIEAMPGLNRARRDAERAMPRDSAAPLGHPLKHRRLPDPGEARVPLSSRQRKARSVTRRRLLTQMPRTEHAAIHTVITNEQAWRAVNDDLSSVAGDAQALDERRRIEVQRIDRAVQRYERANDRGHLVYANLELPAAINHSNLGGFLGNEFTAGDVLSFDRYTGAAHTMHQIEPDTTHDAQRMAVLEIRTRRGIYLGRSDSIDNTSHLLPRGLQLRVVGSHLATYRRPDGTTFQRHVIQLVDIDDEAAPPAGRQRDKES